ncbi:sensor histidine kinase [Desulfoscipio gibsoniae]|uniref:Histidine kinase n=1 Tax=Desulfoscipio gibsoniae DSM 7213 TaxID=767817 RepID=R4KFD6_9FIRM|nr:GHKL domain-containing protein [Desulfoscipio gibsoniae]AGL01893.1 histidine kinase [Desulfoscipio gibsoniae DSM 7213]
MVYFESNNNIHKLTVSLLAFNLLILVGARTSSYYSTQHSINELLFPLVTVINFVIALLFYLWMSRIESLQREAQLHKISLYSVEEAMRTMRSERHDFINHLQAIYGLIAVGNNEEAANYLKSMGADYRFNSQLLTINNPYLRTLLQNKKQDLFMQGIDLIIEVNSRLEHFILKPMSITTIFGNLIDNATEAIKATDVIEKKEIRFEIHQTKNYYSFLVIDSAPPISQEITHRIFDSGFSTKGENRGYGLALVKQTLKEYRGDIVYDPGIKAFNVTIPK